MGRSGRPRPGLLPQLARCAAQRPTAVTRSGFAPGALAVSPAHAPLHQAIFRLCQRVGNDPVAGNPVAGDKGAAASADDVPLAELGSQPRQCAADVVLIMPHLRQSPGLPG